jgi:hypothetical protein
MGQRLGQVRVRYGNHMPIPENISITMPEDYSEERFLKRARTELKWSLWPRRCYSSGRWLWLTPAYRARYVIKGPGDDAVWTRWYNTTEMLMLKLKYGV